MRIQGERPAWLSWWDGRFRSLLFDVGVAILATGLPLNVDRTHTPITICATVGVFVGMLVRRRFPWIAIAATLLGLAAEPRIVAPIFALYAMSSRRGPTVSTAAAVVLVAIVEAITIQYNNDIAPLSLLVAVVGFVGSGTLLGLWIWQRRALLLSMQERTEQAHREKDLLSEQAVAAERRRIAREMHDVVAHRVSIISLQAGALSVTSTDDRTGEVAEVIRKASSSALTELRSMLQVLRDDGALDEDAKTTSGPEPTMDSIGELVEDSIAAGANIQLDLPDPLPDISPEIGRAAYRVVQESLTNAAKHAPHAAVHVRVAEEDGLVLEIANRRSRCTHDIAPPGSGYGLIGMRERVSQAGGSLRAGASDDGGYSVRAQFPPRPAQEAP